MSPSFSGSDLEMLLRLPTDKKKRKNCNGVKLKGAKRCKLSGTEDIATQSRSDSHTLPEIQTVSADQNQSIVEQIYQRLIHRNECTVQISGLPVKCDPSSLLDLAPEALACRMLWNPDVHGSDGIAFLEFPSRALAESYQKKLNNSQYLEKTISARLGKFLPEDVALYDCKKLVVHGLHWKTRVGEIARRFPAAQSIDVRPLSKRADRKRPERAFVTFADAEAALRACDSRQGCVIRKRKLSVFWARKKSNTEGQPVGLVKYLHVSGVRSSVSGADIQSVFPQATSIVINRATGKAWLTYDLEEDCLLDYRNSRGMLLKGRKLKVFLHKSDKLKKFSKEGSGLATSLTSSHENLKKKKTGANVNGCEDAARLMRSRKIDNSKKHKEVKLKEHPKPKSQK